MRKLLIIAAFFSLGLFIQTHLSAQDNPSPTSYHSLDYIKVAPGMYNDYLKLEKAWNKIHTANIKAGKYNQWVMDEVLYPRGANAEYDFITRHAFLGEQQLTAYMEGAFFPKDWQSLLNHEEMALVQRTGEIRTIVKSEVWSSIDGVYADDFQDAKIHVFNFFDRPKGKSRADHIKAEQDVWKPVHQARIDAGTMKGWFLLGMVFPYGANMEYQDATVDVYSSVADYFADSMLDTFNKVHPGKDANKLMNSTWDTATLIRGEVRMMIDRISK